MASFVLLGALVITGGAALTLWSNRQLRALPPAELRTHHPAWKRSGVGLCVAGVGALLIAAANQVDTAAWGGPTPVWAAVGAIGVFFLAATDFLVVTTSRRRPTYRTGRS